jgi:branched-chain amino acid aminotransferase
MLARMTDAGRPERGTHQSLPDPRNEDVLVWIDGELVPRDQAKVSVFDSAFLVGDGVWEGLRLVNGRFAHLDRHLDRLFQGAAAVGMRVGRTREELHDALHETVDANGMRDGVHVRLMISRGTKKTPSQDPRLVVGGPTIVIIAEHKTADPDVTMAGIRLATSATRRPPPDTLDPKLNCHSKLHEVIALVQALRAGADEALMLDPHGFVATCNATNFFVVRRGEVWTSTGRYCMNGITRALVLELAGDLALPARERDISLTEVYDADEAFVTGTFGGLTPVVEVDGRPIGGGVAPGPITARLGARYAELMAAEGAA